jgi:hypothetical protein
MARLLALSAVLLAATSASSPASASAAGHRRSGSHALPASGAAVADDADCPDDRDDTSDAPHHAGLPPDSTIKPALRPALDGDGSSPAVRIAAPRLRPLTLAPKTSPPPAPRPHSS